MTCWPARVIHPPHWVGAKADDAAWSLMWCRVMVQIIFYPSAIGTEPENPGYSSYPHWTRTMIGHAAANMVGGWVGGCWRSR